MTVTFSPPVVTGPLHCDKLSFTLALAPSEHKHVSLTLANLISHDYAKKGKSKLYWDNADIYVGETMGQKLLVQSKPKNPGLSFLRVEFNPAKAHMADVRDFLDTIIPSGGYARLIQHGMCTRVDVAVDIHHAQVDKLLVTHPGLRITENHYSRGRLLQTEYLGAKSSKKQVCIYDKAAHIKYSNAKGQSKQEIPGHPMTRVEVRVFDRFAAKNLHARANPLVGIEIARAKVSMLRGDLFTVFWVAAHVVGAQTVLLRLPSPVRKRIGKRLKLGALSCWKPKLLWEQWPDVASKIMAPPSGGLHLTF